MSLSLEQLQNLIASPRLQIIESPLLESKSLKLAVLRLDCVHPEIQGNKWFKLRLNLAKALDADCKKVISFGGAYSNHLTALAAAGSALGLETVGIVRGEIVEPLNPVIRFLKSKNMRLIPVSRSDYRRKDELSFQKELLQEFGPAYLIPEGGSNELGVRGCEDIAQHIASVLPVDDKTIVALACGTGTTMAGIVNGFRKLNTSNSVLGVSVLKAPGYLADAVGRKSARLAAANSLSWSVVDDYHCGGYGKNTPALAQFMAEYQGQHDLPLEHVYTGKLFFALESMIKKNAFPPGSQICALHTGGIV